MGENEMKIQSTMRRPSLRSEMLMSAAAVAMGVALFGASNQAQAQAAINWSGFYIGGDFGYGGSKFKSTISQPGENKYAKGILGGVHAGYNWQMSSFVFGLEADGSLTDHKTHISDNKFRNDVLASLRGRLGITFNQIMLYGTGGVGLARGKAHSSSGMTKRYSKFRPVLGAGAEFAFNSNFSVRAEFLDYIGNNTSIGGEDSGGNKLGNIWVSRVGFSYKFGSPAAPVMAAAPPPPPPARTAKSFIVFFDFDRSNITAQAQATINDAVAAAKAGNSTRVTLTGHTDRSGSEQYNQALSVRRGEAVKAAMIRGGIPANAIVVIGRGESQPLVPTADGVREPQNRRVEIVI
jgi:outer membrane protein OmpA-like peptidoglycan-associated protein